MTSLGSATLGIMKKEVGFLVAFVSITPKHITVGELEIETRHFP